MHVQYIIIYNVELNVSVAFYFLESKKNIYFILFPVLHRKSAVVCNNEAVKMYTDNVALIRERFS